MYPSITLNALVFYAVRPDLAYLQAGCYLGLAGAAFGLIVVRDPAGPRAARRAGPWTVPLGYVMYCSAELDAQTYNLWTWPTLPASDHAARSASTTPSQSTVRRHQPDPAHPASSGGLDLQVRAVTKPATLRGDPVLTERLMANLIDNAFRHNIPGGRVQVSTGTSHGRAVLSVANLRRSGSGLGARIRVSG
jgi:hypothetical protein